MKKITMLLILILVFGGFPTVSQAKSENSVDMEEYTCRDLMNEKVEDIPLVLMWVDGYISCETGDLTLDTEWMKELSEKIFGTCQNQPEVYLIDIVQKLAEEE